MEQLKKRRKPDEILETIFLKLPKKDVYARLALVCRRFLNITRCQAFTPNLKIKYEFPEVCRKIEQVAKIYPKGTYEVQCTGLLLGYSWMK